jgi:GT2 family glycosyltransferase
MKKAVESGYKYVWVMDDDTFCQPDTLEQFFIADKKLNGDYGWLSSKALWTDGNICETNRQRNLDRNPITYFGDELIQARTATFVSMFFKASVINELGLPIKDFFIWGDDTEYSLRLQRKYPGFVVTGSVVVHAMSVNTTSYATLPPERIPRWFYSIRNEFYIARNYGVRSFVGYYWRYFKHFIQILFFSPSHRLLRIWTLLRGMCAGLFFFPKIEYPETNDN